MRHNSETSIVQILKISGILIVFICFVAFAIIFFTTKAWLDKEQHEKIQSASEIITQAVQMADRSTENSEHLVELRLYSISKAIGQELRGKAASEVGREELERLKEKWGLSGISLFVEKNNDIVVAQSTDEREIGIGSRQWGYWFEAFEQLFRRAIVSVNKGYAEPDFWAGPVTLSTVGRTHYKYVYYFDGSTDFIINCFISAEEMYKLIYDASPSLLIQKIVSSSNAIESIAVINVNAYMKGSDTAIIEPRFDQAVLYGSDKYPIDSDKALYRKSQQGSINETVRFKHNGETFQKLYISIPNHRVIVIAMNMRAEQSMTASLLLTLAGLFVLSIFCVYFVAGTANRKSILMLKSDWERLRVAEDFKQTLSLLPDAVYKFTKPSNGIITIIYNEGTTVEQMNVTTRQVFGKTVAEVYPESFAVPLANALESAFRGNESEFTVEMAGRIYHNVVKPVKSAEQNRIVEAVGYAVDITERKRADDKIRQLAYFDSLTGLPNRASFFEKLEELLERRQADRMLGLIFIDLDNFKHINDTLGHDAGDRLIVQVAERLGNGLPDPSFFARMGGDEFTLLLPGIRSKQDAEAEILRLIQSLREPFFLSGHEISVTLSAGISLCPHDGTDAHTLLKNADIAMYQEKHKDKNNYSFFSQDMNSNVLYNIELHRDLRRAIDHDQFMLVYQPQIDLATQDVVGVEALIRWNHPTKGIVSPAAFIPFAESHGYIDAIGDWTIRSACKQFMLWKEEGLAPLTMSINLSARQFRQKNLIGTIRGIIAETGMDPGYLNFEITESTYMEDVTQTIRVLEQLNKLGAQISIDDFGTGYSSLSYLSRFPIHGLKIDRSFVNEIHKDKSSEAVIKSIMDLANHLNLKVIAEGVEYTEQLSFLNSIGVHQIQGYLFSPPITSEQLVRLVSYGPGFAKLPEAAAVKAGELAAHQRRRAVPGRDIRL